MYIYIIEINMKLYYLNKYEMLCITVYYFFMRACIGNIDIYCTYKISNITFYWFIYFIFIIHSYTHLLKIIVWIITF